MSDTSTDDLPESPPGDEPEAEAHDQGVLDEDAPAEPPVIGCTRCDARVPMGSRYCPSCGTPLVRSGEQAASALSRTRRRAPTSVRILVPLLLVAVVAAIWSVANSDPLEDERDSLRDRLTRVVDGHRTLSDRLEELEGEAEPAEALGAARAAMVTLRDVQDETEGVESGTTGRTTRVRRALETDRLYLTAVIGVLNDPRHPLLSQLGRRSARAVAALRSVEDIAPTKNAIRGTKILGQYVRARPASGSAERGTQGKAKASGPTEARPPFVRAVERVLSAGEPAGDDVARGFDLLRAARDGLASWEGTGTAPASAAAAVREAARVFEDAADARTASAAAAREIPARQENQRAIVAKLAAAYEAAGAKAGKIDGCIGSFRNSDPQSIARQCLEGVRAESATETTRLREFATAYRPARKAAGITGTPSI